MNPPSHFVRPIRLRSIALLLVVTLVGPSTALAQQPEPPNLLAAAVWKYSADGGNTFTLDAPTAKAGEVVVAQGSFTVPAPEKIAGLWLAPVVNLVEPEFTLNGVPAKGLLANMRYQWFDLDPRQVLKGADAKLVVRGKMQAAPPEFKALRLRSSPASDLVIQTGPAIGHVGPDFVTFSCRTNMAATVTAKVKPLDPASDKVSETASPRGFYHRLKVAIPAGTKKISYTMTCDSMGASKTSEPVEVTLPDFSGGKMRFVAAGDSRSNPKHWAAVAAGIEKAAPQLLVFSGDLVADGRDDSQWDAQFFTPGKSMLARTPFYPAPGNHEFDGQAYFKMCYTPAKEELHSNWSQAVGLVLFIGIQGAQDWAPGSENHKWLDQVLGASKEKYIFLVNHYPAWSSGKHGNHEGPIVQMRNNVMPLLVKHKATALIGGHDHNYERNEPPANIGVTSITTGGAGAPLRRKSNRAAADNPYSKSFAATLHYCVFDLDREQCVMKVYDVDGKVIDQCMFAPRLK